MTHVRIVAFFLLLTAPVLAAQQLDQFERILLPVEPAHVDGFLRTYHSALTYASSQPIRYYPASDGLGGPPGIGELTPSTGARLGIRTTYPTNGVGRFLFVDKGAADDLDLTLYLYIDDETYGPLASVPVVRESQFRTGKLVLPGIRLTRFIDCLPKNLGCKTRTEDRLKVYVYDADGSGSNEVSVRVWSAHSRGEPIVLPLARRNGSDPSYPYYGELEVRGIYPDPLTLDTVSVEVQPLHEHARYWAFAIVNPPYSGEAVTVYSPRP
jgi:hypothetical protein